MTDDAPRRADVLADGGDWLPCREFTPYSADGIVVDGELREIEGETVRNWADPDVFHFTNPEPWEGHCRDPGAVTEIVIHETSAPVDQEFESGLENDGLGVQFSVDRDGTIYAHNDVVDELYHAGAHNGVSVGIEVPNPVWEPLAQDDSLYTIPVDWPGREGTQPQGDYVLPSLEQCEGVTSIVETLTSEDGASGTDELAIPRRWFGLEDDGRFRMGGPQQTPNDDLMPGVWAHGHFGGEEVHVDGYFLALYSLLRLEGEEFGEQLGPWDAYYAAQILARSDTSPDMDWENGIPHAQAGWYLPGY